MCDSRADATDHVHEQDAQGRAAFVPQPSQFRSVQREKYVEIYYCIVIHLENLRVSEESVFSFHTTIPFASGACRLAYQTRAFVAPLY